MPSPTFREVMNDLKAAGTAQNRKVYARHGVGEKMFGVNFEYLDKLQKRIKVNHKLAKQLWSSGNYEARVLATKIADPSRLTTAELDAWVKDLDNYGLAGLFAGLVARSPLAQKKMEKWTKAKKEFVGQAGWDVLCSLAMQDNDLADSYLEEYIRKIESGIQTAKNRVKHAMNMALISIGVRNDALRKVALQAAMRIGTVVVDHGETNCRTPDAAEYIRQAVQYRRRHAAKPEPEPAHFASTR